jgi:hypothetical protein
MGVSVIAFSERFEGGRWVLHESGVMNWHVSNYSAFLAGVRNYSAVTPIAKPRGIPSDACREVMDEFRAEGKDAVVPSWLSIAELEAFDYGQSFEDRRVAGRALAGYMDHAVTCAPGEGTITTFRAFLGPEFFEELDRLSRGGAQRVVFWFSV